jgi:Domain of unknown function (DUF1906)
MRALLLVLAVGASAGLVFGSFRDFGCEALADRGHLGFDRNDYPGDPNLKRLRRTFSYSGYWLNNPPGASTNSWTGRRKALEDAGFGFLVVFNGRTDADIKSGGDASKLGSSDAASAVAAAHKEGFPLQTVIFLDQEEGGRLLPEQRSYVHAWVDGVNSRNFSAGVYCSGIASQEASGATVVTANDIRQNIGARRLKYWVVNDACPPSPGCDLTRRNIRPASSGISFADVWQFAQSPRRPAFASGCAAYNQDGNCYLLGLDPAQPVHVDLDIATSTDPSGGRTPH